MKKIIIKSLTLHNFKGVRDLQVDFKETETNIYGHNEVGKTTIMDAFIWLLFGKDSTDRKDFELKTLDENNVVIPKIDHTVTGIITIDGAKTTLTRTLKEKWVKKRGSEDVEFQGNETLFYVDEVPYQAQQYKTYINTIVDELVFKMVTNPLYFPSLKWNDRRDVLVQIAGDIDEQSILNSDPRYKELLDRISGKTFAQWKAQITALKKKLKDDLEQIPSRIDEVTRTIPEKIDFKAVEAEIIRLEKEIDQIDTKIADKSKVSEGALKVIQQKQLEIHGLKLDLEKMYYVEKNNLNREHQEILEKKRGLESDARDISEIIAKMKENNMEFNGRIELKTKDKDDLLKKWYEVDKEVLKIDENSLNCPACKRPLDNIESKQAELVASFNADKIKRKQDISEQGKKVKAEIDRLNGLIKNINEDIPGKEEYLAILYKKISEFEKVDVKEPDLSKNEKYLGIQKEIEKLEKVISSPLPEVNTDDLKLEKSGLKVLLDAMKVKMNTSTQRDKALNRIDELEKESRSLSQQIADIEKDEFTIESFEKAKIDMIEESVNSLFKYIKVKMFRTLINGSIEPCCDVLYKGVPFDIVNSAHKIWSGIDIINTLNNFYSVSAPIWIDNRESTINLPETSSQVINLFVSIKDVVLRID